MRAKVTQAMVTAGVNALAYTRKQPDEAVVAAVFQAMHRADQVDKAQKATGQAPPYVYQPFPSWRYGPGGKSKLCQTEADVPEGWATSPADVATPKKGPARAAA